MADNQIHIQLIIPSELSGSRIDVAIAKLLPDYSRARIQDWILAHELLVNEKAVKPKDKVCGGEKIDIQCELEDEGDWQAQEIPLQVIYEDKDIIVIDKPVGLVVHPGAGIKDGTLVNALLYHYPELAKLPRAGIVHRLDKDTSGLMVVARSIKAHTHLVQALSERVVKRTYHALVNGDLIQGGKVDAPIGRDPSNRIKMAVVPTGKPAITHYSILERFGDQTYVECRLETGRTHQIRVHMAHIGHSLVGDQTYGLAHKNLQFKNFKRQALHAVQLSFVHPEHGEVLTFTSALPEDFSTLLRLLGKQHD
jgi:23S rRNA pseudouridine1911/1915/1917 synthase